MASLVVDMRLKNYQNLQKHVTFLGLMWNYFNRCIFTQDRYPIKRGSFGNLTDGDIAKFESILEKHRVLTGDETQGYNIDWIGSVRGFSNVVLKPKTTEEVSEIMKYCSSRKLAVCPQGGNTGLVNN